jgi:hypothetical protein
MRLAEQVARRAIFTSSDASVPDAGGSGAVRMPRERRERLVQILARTVVDAAA